jgi:capsular polysaccharide biosynthesis protein
LNGLEQVRIDQPAVRLRLEKCFVPTPSFAMGSRGYADVRHLWAPRRVSERLMSVRRKDDRPVYLSRSRLPDRAYRCDVINETELEARLESSGVLVVHPQELTLAEQVEMINTHSVFIGPWGSALHGIVFCLPGHAITTFVLTESFVSPEYVLVNAIVENNAHYLEVILPSESPGNGRKLKVDVDATIDYLREFGVV